MESFKSKLEKVLSRYCEGSQFDYRSIISGPALDLSNDIMRLFEDYSGKSFKESRIHDFEISISEAESAISDIRVNLNQLKEEQKK